MKENNKLIAEFMGYENTRGEKEHPLYKIPAHSYEEAHLQDGYMETIDTFSPFFDEMKFHSSWDWIMPVVNKILDDEEIDLGYISYRSEEAMFIKDSLIECNLENLYKSVIEFIKWYNTTHQKTKPSV